MAERLLEVKGLKVRFATEDGVVRAVDGVDFELDRGRVLGKHVLRNSLIPIVSLFALDFAAVLGGGAILTETVFDLKGVGWYAAQSVGDLDLPPIMGVTLYGAFFIVVFSALVDFLYAFLDPRIRPT